MIDKRQAKREVCAFIAGIMFNFEAINGWPNASEKELQRLQNASESLWIEMLRRSGEDVTRNVADGSSGGLNGDAA